MTGPPQARTHLPSLGSFFYYSYTFLPPFPKHRGMDYCTVSRPGWIFSDCTTELHLGRNSTPLTQRAVDGAFLFNMTVPLR